MTRQNQETDISEERNRRKMSVSLIQPIPTHFKHGDFDSELLSRSGDVVQFEKLNPSHSRETFEVVIVKSHPAETICGCEYPARESMPSSEAWGPSDWTYTELEGAQRKFFALAAARQEGSFQPAVTPASAFLVAGSIRTADTTENRFKR